MAARPWITPEQVRAYTDNPKTARRDDEKLKTDVARAELYIISYTKNSFDDEMAYPAPPEPVALAALLLAEMYAGSAAETRYKSETFDDYSYTLADTGTKLENLDLGPLLDDYVQRNIKMRGV